MELQDQYFDLGMFLVGNWKLFVCRCFSILVGVSLPPDSAALNKDHDNFLMRK